MPYIKQEDRDFHSFNLIGLMPTGSVYFENRNPGQLNYLLSSFVDLWITFKGGPSYTTYNEVIGVLECMKMELYRRFVGPYEDEKLAENGEVFSHHLPKGGDGENI